MQHWMYTRQRVVPRQDSLLMAMYAHIHTFWCLRDKPWCFVCLNRALKGIQRSNLCASTNITSSFIEGSWGTRNFIDNRMS